MSTFRIRRNQDAFEPALYDLKIVDTANPFGTYAVAKIDDTDGTKFDNYPRGTRVDVFATTGASLPLIVESGETVTVASGDTRTDPFGKITGTLQVAGTQQFAEQHVRKFPGFVVERRELDRQGADALEIEIYSFDQFLRRGTVTNDQSGKTLVSALEDIIKTDTPVTWNADNVTVEDSQTLTQSYRGEKIENVLLSLQSKSANEDFGVNKDLEFFWQPRANETAPRDIDDSNAIEWDIPEKGKETVNEVTVFYDSGNKSVTVDDGGDKLDLQDNLGTDDPVTFETEVSRPNISDIEDARAVGEEILNGRETTLTGTVTTFGLIDANPGDTININITSRGISGDFRIAELEHNWGEQTTVVTIVEKTGEQDELLVRLSDTLKRVETKDVNRDAIKNRITSTNVGVEIDIQGDVGGNSFTAARLTNSARNLIRDGWAGDGNLSVADIKVGNDATQPKRSQTALGNSLDTQSVSETLPNSTTARYQADTSETDIREVGLFNSAGDMLARAIIDDVSLSGTTTVTIDAVVSNDSDVAKGVITDNGQTAVRDVIADNSPALPTQYAFGSDGSDPSTGENSLGTQETVESLDELLVQSADATSDWQDATNIADTDPLKIESGTLKLLQTCFTVEGESEDRGDRDFLDASRFSGNSPSGGTAVEFNTSGQFVEYDFTTEHDIPDGNFEISVRWDGNDSSNQGQVDWYLDGELLGQAVAATNDPGWRDFVDQNLDNPGRVEAGDHTVRLEAVGSWSGGEFWIDVMAPNDDRHTYTFDNTLDSNNSLSGPELFPQAFREKFATANTRRKLDSATLTQTWNNTSNGQQLAMSNDGGSTFKTSANTQSFSTTFAGSETGIVARVDMSRFGSQTKTPTSGINGQEIGDHDMTANIDAITPVDTGIADIRAITQPNTINGTTLREAGQLDSNNNLLTSVVFAEFTVSSDERIISSERIDFRNP